MDTNDVLGPFQAGDGGLPPYLAGREYEQDLCLAFVSRLRLGRPPPREIVFYGPRGNGKTALLPRPHHYSPNQRRSPGCFLQFLSPILCMQALGLCPRRSRVSVARGHGGPHP